MFESVASATILCLYMAMLADLIARTWISLACGALENFRTGLRSDGLEGRGVALQLSLSLANIITIHEKSQTLNFVRTPKSNVVFGKLHI